MELKGQMFTPTLAHNAGVESRNSVMRAKRSLMAGSCEPSRDAGFNLGTKHTIHRP